MARIKELEYSIFDFLTEKKGQCTLPQIGYAVCKTDDYLYAGEPDAYMLRDITFGQFSKKYENMRTAFKVQCVPHPRARALPSLDDDNAHRGSRGSRIQSSSSS